MLSTSQSLSYLGEVPKAVGADGAELTKMTEFVARVGTFFLLIGLGFGILFIASDMAASSGTGMRTDYNYLCIGTILLSLGFSLRAQGRPPLEPSGRFRGIRGWLDRRKNAREEKEKAKQQVKK